MDAMVALPAPDSTPDPQAAHAITPGAPDHSRRALRASGHVERETGATGSSSHDFNNGDRVIRAGVLYGLTSLITQSITVAPAA